jgi:hypothetical protein
MTGSKKMKDRVQIRKAIIEAVKSELQLTFGEARQLNRPTDTIDGRYNEFSRLFKRPPTAEDPLHFDEEQEKPVRRSLETMLADLLGTATGPNFVKHFETIALLQKNEIDTP